MPNPSELQRVWEEEEIEKRNQQMKALQDSRNKITDYNTKLTRLRNLIDVVKGRNSKGVKVEALREVRQLEQELGFDLGNYNSGNFAATIAKSS